MSLSLPLVEALLQEFYQPTTPNARKREIETELMAYKSQPTSWQLCLRVTTSSMDANQFVWFFCASTLEHAITRRWDQLTSTERTLIRETLWNSYANISVQNVPRRQRDTIALLIAQMGKREFPNAHPNYINHCVELLKSKFALGINLLRITSEELVSTREDVTTDHKNYFHSCISMCFPDVMDLVTQYLLIAVCHINGKDVRSVPNTILDCNLITSLPNDCQLSASVLDLLRCVQHIVTWVRTDLISEYFLMSILDLSQWRPAYQDISFAGLSVLSELLYLQKPMLYIMTLMSGVNGLLDQHNTTKQQSEMYMDKLRELLRLFTSKYAAKMINESELLDGFLKSLYCCTIIKNGALDLSEKLEIWTPIIKGLVQHSKLNRYNDIVHQLVAEIMRRIQFEFNKAELELLDNESVDEQMQTEWQQFINQCIECIALVAEAHPQATFAQVLSHWSRPHVYLLSIENDIDCRKHYELTRKLKCFNFNEHLRDFATVCQAVVRIVPLLDPSSANVGSEVETHLQLLAENLLVVLKFLSSNKLGTLEFDKSTFQTDVDYLYAQILMAISSILPIVNLKSEELLRSLFDILGAIFLNDSMASATSKPVVYLAASQLLLCISSVIRPKCLLEIPTIISLMQAGPKLAHLPRQVTANIYISLISYLVLPWRNVSEQQQDFPRRYEVMGDYIDCLAHSLVDLDLNGETKIGPTILQALNTFTLVIEYFRDASGTTKDVLASAFKPAITKALVIYNIFGLSNNSVAITVADLSLSVLGTLQSQLGSHFIREMITLFITVSSREQITVGRLAVMERVLQMFRLIVEQPSSISLSMLPAILDFTLEQILPLLQQESITANSDISSAVYNLFDSILLNKWQYFYKSQVQHNGSLHQTSGEILHHEHFTAMLNSYGQILITGNDLNLVRTVLQSMQNVNERWRLYQRQYFKDNLLASFQKAIINVLLSGEGAILYDSLAQALYAMGLADSLKLRECFATVGVPVNLKLLDEICLSTDIPTFSQKLTQLIQDAHCVYLSQT